jgi:hypothetical protein
VQKGVVGLIHLPQQSIITMEKMDITEKNIVIYKTECKMILPGVIIYNKD